MVRSNLQFLYRIECFPQAVKVGSETVEYISVALIVSFRAITLTSPRALESLCPDTRVDTSHKIILDVQGRQNTRANDGRTLARDGKITQLWSCNPYNKQ